MKSKSLLLISVLLMLGMAAPVAAEPGAPVELAGAGELAILYQQATGYAPNAEWFGAYSLAPVGDDLYMGLGTARPGEEDGALLAHWRDGVWTPVYAPSEQGFIGMAVADGRLYIPGPDPMDDWTAGNVYIHDLATGETVKRRSLTNVLHDWGLWRDPATGRLVVAVGAHAGDNATWSGGLYISEDDGQSWRMDRDGALGQYRTYDVIGVRRGLVAVAADEYVDDGCQLAVQSAAGQWRRVASSVVCRTRLFADASGRFVLALKAGGVGLADPLRGQAFNFPGFTAETWAYNWLASNGAEYFVVTSDGRVMGSHDLRAWREVASFGQRLLSVAYWPERASLIVAERGTAGRLWLVPIGSVGLIKAERGRYDR